MYEKESFCAHLSFQSQKTKRNHSGSGQILLFAPSHYFSSHIFSLITVVGRLWSGFSNCSILFTPPQQILASSSSRTHAELIGAGTTRNIPTTLLKLRPNTS